MAYQDSNLRQELLITTSLLRHDVVYIVYSSAHDLLYPNKPRSCERNRVSSVPPLPFPDSAHSALLQALGSELLLAAVR